MAGLFDEIKINKMILRNRSVRSATWTGMARKDGTCSPKLIKLTEKLARGEVGLIITGFTYVMPNGQALPGQLGIHNNAMTPNLRKLTKAVHAAKGKICMQIVHAGVQTGVKDRGTLPVWGPSAVHDKLYGWTPKPVTQKEIKETVEAFAGAAARAKRAGFDAVQLHGAHGFLISQFLSPARNRRTDKYGGPIENRARFLFEVFRAVRKAVGKDFPVLIKLNTQDFVRGGFHERDALFVAKRLDKMGIDAIEMSGGVPAAGDLSPARTKIRKTSDEAYFLSIAKKIKKQVSVPIILVGGVRSLQAISQILEKGDADLVSMARPLIREPGLVRRWRKGDKEKAKCISCNQCFGAAMSPQGVYCVVERRLKKRKKK
ncbi:MAG: NADH:flavin oxidoreductase [Deltaproteobacteria bacterium]|nr:NADH:flavin oxidoreductase [Deltaproteobacteria bacterium]MBW2170554.1 NADH:flavin oxidoreductase [Deltaproteobacteria bacterium]MBW2259886.1 NADH:flavin oxidoreductase [Deltaproteobacteria bacterium]